jgi:hypothetical protein
MTNRRPKRLKLHYVVDGQLEEAIMKTGDGTYVCTVERCSEEGRESFRSRARHLMRLLTEQRGTIIAAGGDEI